MRILESRFLSGRRRLVDVSGARVALTDDLGGYRLFSVPPGNSTAECILSPNVRINSYAQVEESILFSGVNVGRHSRIRRAIIDKDVKLPAGTTIGYDLNRDRKRGLVVTEQGIVVVAKGEAQETFTANV